MDTGEIGKIQKEVPAHPKGVRRTSGCKGNGNLSLGKGVKEYKQNHKDSSQQDREGI